MREARNPQGKSPLFRNALVVRLDTCAPDTQLLQPETQMREARNPQGKVALVPQRSRCSLGHMRAGTQLLQPETQMREARNPQGKLPLFRNALVVRLDTCVPGTQLFQPETQMREARNPQGKSPLFRNALVVHCPFAIGWRDDFCFCSDSGVLVPRSTAIRGGPSHADACHTQATGIRRSSAKYGRLCARSLAS